MTVSDSNLTVTCSELWRSNSSYRKVSAQIVHVEISYHVLDMWGPNSKAKIWSTDPCSSSLKHCTLVDFPLKTWQGQGREISIGIYLRLCNMFWVGVIPLPSTQSLLDTSTLNGTSGCMLMCSSPRPTMCVPFIREASVSPLSADWGIFPQC